GKTGRRRPKGRPQADRVVRGRTPGAVRPRGGYQRGSRPGRRATRGGRPAPQATGRLARIGRSPDAEAEPRVWPGEVTLAGDLGSIGRDQVADVAAPRPDPRLGRAESRRSGLLQASGFRG